MIALFKKVPAPKVEPISEPIVIQEQQEETVIEELIPEPPKPTVFETHKDLFDGLDKLITEKYNLSRPKDLNTYFFKSKWGIRLPIIIVYADENQFRINNFKGKQGKDGQQETKPTFISINYSTNSAPEDIFETIEDNMQQALRYNEIDSKDGKEYSLLNNKFTQQLIKENRQGSKLHTDKFTEPRQLGTFLKKYFSTNYDLEVSTRHIPSESGFEHSFFEVFPTNARQGDKIPNKFRRLIIDRLFDTATIKDKANITYGNISGAYTILMVSEWNTLFDR